MCVSRVERQTTYIGGSPDAAGMDDVIALIQDKGESRRTAKKPLF